MSTTTTCWHMKEKIASWSCGILSMAAFALSTKTNKFGKMETCPKRRLRNKKSDQEYLELKQQLDNFGCFDDDIEIEELRHLVKALQCSAGMKSDMPLNKMPRQSTTTKTSPLPSPSGSQCFTPPNLQQMCRMQHSLDVIHLTVQAQVHHPNDWSPSLQPALESKESMKSFDDNQAVI